MNLIMERESTPFHVAQQKKKVGIMMIISMKKHASKKDIEHVMQKFKDAGLQIHESIGENYNVFGIVGDTSCIDIDQIEANPYVEHVQRIAAPYKLANRMFHPQDTIVDVNGIHIGGKKPIVVIGGPCSVESEEMIERIAYKVKRSRCVYASWWCLQTSYFSLCFSRYGNTRDSRHGKSR